MKRVIFIPKAIYTTGNNITSANVKVFDVRYPLSIYEFVNNLTSGGELKCRKIKKYMLLHDKEHMKNCINKKQNKPDKPPVNLVLIFS